MPGKDSRVGKVWSALTQSRTVLPARYRHLNPELHSLWSVLALSGILAAVLLYFLYSSLLSTTFDYQPIKPLSELRPMVPPASPSGSPSTPRFAEGTTVQVRQSGVIYAGPGTDPLPPADHRERTRGVVLDGVWSQGRWLYQVQFSLTQVGWVAERDLERSGSP